MNGLGLILPESIPDFLKDSDNMLILVLILLLMKQKTDNRALIIALMSILMQE